MSSNLNISKNLIPFQESGFFYGVPLLHNLYANRIIYQATRSGYPLYSRLTKTTAKKPCFSKSGDAVPILHTKASRHLHKIPFS
ncbi:hypothetical protein DOS84_05790 [Flavobacterium aquariorum]|uniref:Uncharacterized protein n=1 Tax=Flavobacterium aquariorum TaxID=2217670 RepID=A0A2W7UL74_9FLAO|nr:hypothetical protein DOS84_05790 [Flavobacterium aquariorum]